MRNSLYIELTFVAKDSVKKIRSVEHIWCIFRKLFLCDSPKIKLGWRAIAGTFLKHDDQDRNVYHFECLNTLADESDNNKKCT